jgi:chromosome segregation protein
MEEGLATIDRRFAELFANLPNRFAAGLCKFLIQPLGPHRHGPKDKVAVRCAEILMAPSATRDRLTSGLHRGCGNDAIATLEDAIRRMDRDTRALLKETYDRVNTEFGRIFPELFGGGEARLVMTGDEILDAGLQVFAQPPGKRNASIQLLSGGEKALTATALVFAFFQLNPAPFCMLDEVDAPLDDTNTERFCEMVKRMSAATQFVFISHNKITMEMAQQLVGVTMQERGCSRVVEVDMEAALKLRDEALSV